MRATKSKSTTASKGPSKQSGEEWVPLPYMVRAAEFLLERSAAALFLDPGLRKTSITLAAIKVLRNEGLLCGALVVCPKRVMDLVWRQEAERWSCFHDLSIGVLHGKHKAHVAKQPHDIFLINYEGLAWLHNSGTMREMLRDRRVDTIVFDELSRIKKSTTTRFKSMETWLPRFARRWGLTGSPAANGLMGLFGQMYVLDLGLSFGPFITHFRARYFEKYSDYVWKIQPGAEQRIYEKVKPVALRLNGADYLKLPKLMPPTVIKYDLPEPVRKLYEELEDEAIVFMDDGEPLSSPGAGALKNKLRQVAGGAAFRNMVHPVTGQRIRTAEEPYVWLHDEKLDALEDLVEELQGAQLIIAYEWKHDLWRLQERFGDRMDYIGGGVSEKKATEVQKRWNAGELQLLALQPSSAALGLNLQGSHACHVAWFTIIWDYELYDQLIRRLLRSGNKAARLFVYLFIGRHTADEDVAGCIRGKRRTQDDFFEAVEAGVRQRATGRGRLKLVGTNKARK